MNNQLIRNGVIGLFSTLALSACGGVSTILYSPAQTPAAWLQRQPYIAFKRGSQEIVLVQPSTSAIVYLLGILSLAVGLYYLKIQEGQQSRLWWGIAFLLWGLGALLAGTSYEASSYAIKCAGRDACVWTSWWEIGYLVVSVWSIDAMVVADAAAGTSGKWRQGLTAYAWVNALVYLIVVMVGVLHPVKFLISFEFLLPVSAPDVLALFVPNLGRYLKYKDGMDLALLGAWGWLGITIAAYFIYYSIGLTQTVWVRGAWFSENDILHMGLILWMLYFAVFVSRGLKDAPQEK